MRKMFLAILALAGVSSLFAPVRVYAQEEGVKQMKRADLRGVTRAARLHSSDGTDPDTVWIGHIYDAAYTAGGKMQAGGYGPYHVGRGPNLPTRSGGTLGDNGVWDFDRFQAGECDSLQGWWPVARPYQSGAATFGDYRRSFFGFDYGNQANYVINQGFPKRTFGVTGLWHRDGGGLGATIPGTNPTGPSWTGTFVGGAGSTASAWMGIRSHGDLTVRDEVANGGTGNYFNASVLEYQGNNAFNQAGSSSNGGANPAKGTDHNFPGYGSQMDQMLYRDVVLAEGDGLVISFNYSTEMSTNKNTTTTQRIGWFDKDPISPAQVGDPATSTPSSDGNFISSSVAGAGAPCDSFMVYVGAPVNDAAVRFSNASLGTVYDAKRRWFSEVLRCVPADNHYKELVSVAGINAPNRVSVDVGALYPAVLTDIKAADGVGGNGGVARIVFRVKTNRGYDDENGSGTIAPFDSGTRGAAIVDNVVVNGWAAANGNFEATDAINNDTGVSATAAWKSTGKPPAVYWHAHQLSGAGLIFNDPCGTVDNPNRLCNLYGKIVTPGDHDFTEKDGGLFGSNSQDRARVLASPTINLMASGNGAGNYNAMGIDNEIATTDGDYYLFGSLYNAGFLNATTETGNFFQVMWQSYPAVQKNGNKCWGELRAPPFISFYGSPQACFETFYDDVGAKSNSQIRTTNAANKPDSLRAFIHRISRCYSFAALTASTCSPLSSFRAGTYFDNVSVALVDGVTPPGISIAIWNLINDAFPTNGLNGDGTTPGTANFDTTAAQVRIGLNIASATGDNTRPAITGDSVIVLGSGTNTRMDMVFRILPGPGNYMTKGTKSSGVARRPDGKVGTSQTITGLVKATPGDGSFFGEYMAAPGDFSKGTHGTQWNQHTWNSARMDTSENNLFPTGDNGSVVHLTPGEYMGTLHESDPKFATLGILKNRCYKVVPNGQNTNANIVCIGAMSGVTYPASSGWDGTQQTREFTKIIPDGLLTPGSHVQYFFRKSDLPTPTVYELAPDTMLIFQDAEGSTDGHRWQQFGVLPDRWKDGAWSVADRNASAPATLLFVDWNDRRGDERFWVSIADSIGATLPARFGAHNGWHAAGYQDITVPVGNDPTIAVYAHGGQPGTTWDMFGVKASESFTTSTSLASRSAAQPGPSEDQHDKQNKNGPTGDMLTAYYKILLALTGDLNAGAIGPFVDRTDNDTGLLNDFTKASQPRVTWFGGDAFVEGQIQGGAAAHAAWCKSFFNADLANASYRNYALNANDVVDLTPHAPLGVGGQNDGPYSVFNSCFIEDDVMLFSAGNLGSVGVTTYPTGNGHTDPIATIYTPNGGGHPGISIVDGFQLASLGAGGSLYSVGATEYYWNVLTHLTGGLNPVNGTAPTGVGENPNVVNFLALLSENPFRSGAAKISFGIAKREKVELKVYDVAGRLVKTLANREFEAGSHSIFWDGSNNDGRQVSRGVYFYQLHTPSFVSQKKLAVLKN